MAHLITLPAVPYEAGRILGAHWRSHLNVRVRATKARLAQVGCSSGDVADKISSFRALLGRFVPHWLDEARGIADGAGIAEDELLLLNAVPVPEPRRSQGNCSSFVWVEHEWTALFKIRDEKPHPQVLYAYRTVDGRMIQVGKDIGNLGAAHGIAHGGVAVGNNTGSRVDDIAPDPRLNDCHLLRYVVENARTVDDVEPLIERAFQAGVVGGASVNRGSILLVADAAAAMVAEISGARFATDRVESGRRAVTNHFQLPEAVGWIAEDDGRNSLVRLERLSALLEAAESTTIVEDAIAMSRDRENYPDALCNDDATKPGMTVSAQLHLLKSTGGEPRARTIACCGNTRNSVFLSIPAGTEEVPASLVAGDVFERANALYRAFGCDDHLARRQRSLEASLASTDSTDYRIVVNEFLSDPRSPADTEGERKPNPDLA